MHKFDDEAYRPAAIVGAVGVVASSCHVFENWVPADKIGGGLDRFKIIAATMVENQEDKSLIFTKAICPIQWSNCDDIIVKSIDVLLFFAYFH